MLKPRYYQLDAFNAFFEYTANNWGKHPLIVLPTGAGKSYVQAMIVEHMLQYDHTRILLVTHQQELIKQNYIELVDNFDGQLLDTGIYSAGLKCRDTKNRIIFAGIQSVYKRAWELGWFDLILVDEAHRIPQDNMGTYRKFLGEMVKINKNVVIGGLSATPYRMKSGLLCEGKDKIFDDICHNTSIPELINPNHFKNRDRKQYLCEIISKNAVNKADMTGVHIRGGDYAQNEMETAFRKGDLVEKAVCEIKDYTTDRNKILVFTSGIQHCEEVTEKLNRIGCMAKCIHSQKSDQDNEDAIKGFKKGEFRFLVNVDILTTGFNEKAIDCICMLRSTRSPGLYYQIAGRGLRMHELKTNCLYLDFGGNILFHGPIDKIEIRSNKKTGKKEIGTNPMKECPQCQQLLFIAVAICPTCGFVFKEDDEYNHDEKASEADILSKWKKPKEVDIEYISYSRHQKQGKPDSMKVSYYYNDQLHLSYDEYVCLDHPGYAGQKAVQWVKKRTNADILNVDHALLNQTIFREPKKIIVDLNGKFPQITGYIFETDIQDIPARPLTALSQWPADNDKVDTNSKDDMIPF